MSQQLALSSLFSVLALASLCLAAGNGSVGHDARAELLVAPAAMQAERTPGLPG